MIVDEIRRESNRIAYSPLGGFHVYSYAIDCCTLRKSTFPRFENKVQSIFSNIVRMSLAESEKEGAASSKFTRARVRHVCKMHCARDLFRNRLRNKMAAAKLATHIISTNFLFKFNLNSFKLISINHILLWHVALNLIISLTYLWHSPLIF